MCDDYSSDSGSFDDVSSSDFDSDFDSDVSSDFDSFDFSDDIETMDFDDDIETLDFDDDIETLDFDDDIETLDFDDGESSDIDDDIESLDIDDDVEIMEFDDDIESLDIDDDVEIMEFDDDTESLDIDDDVEIMEFDDDIESLDIEDNIETLDLEDDIEISEFSEDIEEMNIEEFSEDAFDIEESFDEADMDITDEVSDIETELDNSEVIDEVTEAEELDFDDDIDSIEFEDEAEDIDISEDVEDIDDIESDNIMEDLDFDDETEEIDIDDIDLNEAVEGEDIAEVTDDIVDDEDSFENIDEADIVSEDTLEDALTDLEAENAEIDDIGTYIDSDELSESSEDIDWDSMLSDGDRDYINDVMSNETYTQEQKDFLINQHLSEVYERETTEPEYGGPVRGLTYDGRDIMTGSSEEYNGEVALDESLLDNALNNENLSAENLSNLRDYIESVSNDDSLTDDEKSFLINEALGFASEMNSTTGDIYQSPASAEGVAEVDAPAEVTETINDAPVNEYNEPFSGELSEQDIDTVYEGLDEYDFHGVDCLEDTERLDASLENFTSENWENLSLDEQKEQMTELAQYIIDVTGLENPPKIEFYNSGKDGDYGGFNRATNTLSINEHMLYQNDEAADTVAHELWHAYQYERASNPSTKLDHMYLENFNDYITPDDDFEGYQSQIIESEARAFAQQIKDRLHSY